MCIPKCHWKIIVVNLVEQRCFFFVTLPGGLVLCVPGQYRVFPPLAAIIAASRRGILATRRWRRCTGICANLSSRAWRSSSRVHRADCSAQFIPKMFYGVTVGRSWRLLHLCDIALLVLEEIENYPSTMRSGVVILIAVVVPEIMPGKWHSGVLQNAPIEHTG